jgi:putative heme-binding domain-containing protein
MPFFGGTSRAVVSEDVLPRAEWISAPVEGAAAQTAFFRLTFSAPPRLMKAVALGACDEEMTVTLNGKEGAKMAGYKRAASADITPYVRPGQNVIAVRVDNRAGLAAFCLMIELATAGGRQHWIVSNGSWKVSLDEQPNWQRLDFAANDWLPARVHGDAGRTRWGNPFAATKSVDAYNSWMLARDGARATDPATIQAPPGFRVELLHSARPEEGSWIALAFDPKGRLTVAREKRGLLRLTLARASVAAVEVIDDTLLECRGLLYAYDALYANANNSKGLYRLRDTDGDDRFDETQLLLATSGGVGHGRNQLRLGPDGLIYVVHGNDVELPANVDPHSALRHFAADQLFPLRWGEHGTSDYVRPPHGHILATDRDGKTWRLIAGGLRNPLDLAFNEAGDMFTYEADNERDIGAPWYKPTRVLHIVSGGEYGWRPGAGKFPPYLPDTLPSVVDIGIGSPCGVEFGTASRFPEPWRRALFIADWAYGRIVAVQLQTHGASYEGRAKPFVSGRPLNVTDLTIGPDGAIYFVTGGRGTQSGLYRVTYTGESRGPVLDPEDASAASLRALRTKLELAQTALSEREEETLAFIWANLAHADRFIAYAARVALEAQPQERWEEKALTAKDPAALHAMLALARVASKKTQRPLLMHLRERPLRALPVAEQLVVVRVYALCFARMGPPPDDLRESILNQLEPLFLSANAALDHELCRLLVYLGSKQVVSKATAALASAHAADDRLHYLWHLRLLREGWTLEQRRVAFSALERAERQQGAREYLAALRLVRTELVAALRPDERAALADLVEPKPVVAVPATVDLSKYSFAQAWTMRDFTPQQLSGRGSIEHGRDAFSAAQCVRCHRAANAPGGTIGPDLTGVAARFGRRELLEQILEPSKVVDPQYRPLVVTLTDATTYVGTPQREDDKVLTLNIGLGVDETIDIDRSQIAERKFSEQSPMPAGLLNILNAQQILDLLAYLESSGVPARADDP